MSTIKFTSLSCIRQQDVVGKDEPHLYLDGVDSWNGVLGKGDSAQLGLSKPFDGSMTVTLKEKNPSSWKTIGTVTINTNKVSPAVFKTSGAHYELWFNVKS
jgi:hypothetical protein